MCFACSCLYCCWLFWLCRFQIVFIDLIYKATCLNFLSLRRFSLLTCTFFFLYLTFFFFVTFFSCFLFFLKFLFALDITWFCICVIIIILWFFFQKLRNYVKDDKEKNSKSKNNKTFYTLCSSQKISYISNRDNNLRNILLYFNSNRFCILICRIYHFKNIILFIHLCDHISICFRITLIKNKIAYGCF